ncbi:3'-5' exonuclease [Parabacteroides distasonis]|uniref:3'-5' exonuclease n=1 Tax=Parabacteroides distasonis TaxID=823 RepID=UPI001C3C497B|nr:3'-5' exonuclease [Parabacteroides distasonis]MCR1852052.1 AAA family ATPase [Parabacteroides distasonis]
MKKDWMIKESELDEDQIKVLMAVLDKSCIVTGCAGSGKSVLALIKAQRIQKERGDNYKIIVFTKALCEYMNAGRESLGLKNTFIHHWAWKNRENCSSADYIIVDEIQDFEEEEIQEFIGAANKHFIFFGDTAQSIYEGLKDTLPVEYIGDLLPRGEKPKIWELYRNYRLPIPVAKLVQSIGIDLPPFVESTYKSIETVKPYVLKYDDVRNQLVAIKRIIERKDLSDVAILLPHNDMVKSIGNELKELEMNVELRYTDKENWRNSKDTLNFSSSNPKVMTYHSAKGLQFETVFLPCIEDFRDDGGAHRKSLYVAMTRTSRNLYVMYSGILPTPLSDISPDLYEISEIEEIEDI